MGGGHIIIIRNSLRAPASLGIVRENLRPAKQAKLDEILEKNEAEWSDAETHFLLRAVADAYDEVT